MALARPARILPSVLVADIVQVGLNLDDPEYYGTAAINRSDIRPTIIEAIGAISLLFSDIKLLREKYQLKKYPFMDRPSCDLKTSPSSKGLRTLSIIRSNSLRQRIRENQKEKSVVSIAKWALRDAKKFEDKLKQVKSLISGLEEVGVLTSAHTRHTSRSISLLEEIPPPYSLAVVPATALPLPTSQPSVVDLPRTARPARLSDNSISDLLEHHAVYKRYLAGLPVSADHSQPRARDKLKQLTEQQFKELRIDVCDELLRRQRLDNPPKWLPDVVTYHPKRNEARRKLSTLVNDRFGHLIFDIVRDLERRFPQLQERTPRRISVEHVFTPRDYIFRHITYAPRDPTDTRRWGCVNPRPPPFLVNRAAYQFPSPKMPSSSSSLSSSATFRESTIFKTFNVGLADTTTTILPAVLQEYAIRRPSERYNLFIVVGDEERCLGPDERPLAIFKALSQEGKDPVFMLRKKSKRTSSSSQMSTPLIGESDTGLSVPTVL